MLILDEHLQSEIIRQRRECGGDRYDEVWEGQYIVAPLANNEHQRLATRIAGFFDESERSDGSVSLAGCNVSNRSDDWMSNFRCPDVALYRRGTSAIDRGTHYQGGPDLAIEIVSRGDRSREKFEFYASVGTAEVLIIDRSPWQIELYRLAGGVLEFVGRSVDDANRLVVCGGRYEVWLESSGTPAVGLCDSATGRTRSV